MRLSDRTRRINRARMQVEGYLAGAMVGELASLWRDVYPKVRRLSGKRPIFKVTETDLDLQKAFLGGNDIWLRFQVELEHKFYEALKNGVVTFTDVHNLWAQSQDQAAGSFFIEPEEITDSLQPMIGSRISRIANETRQKVGVAVREWYNAPGETLDDLVTTLHPLFDDRRAQRIAITETTWLNSEVTRSRMDILRIDEWWWNTARDEIVCPLCRRKHGNVFHRNDPMPPEASHPNCRCNPVEIVPIQARFSMPVIKKFVDLHPRDARGRFIPKGLSV